ncbi:hypothetical protein Scep_001002 [Stephania cephalantha]|uniref:Uncharacterized protein n=1 Tax=Stephania cephalantha TaxID=152367 RepID=A0AAP0L7M0_9MAGN
MLSSPMHEILLEHQLGRWASLTKPFFPQNTLFLAMQIKYFPFKLVFSIAKKKEEERRKGKTNNKQTKRGKRGYQPTRTPERSSIVRSPLSKQPNSFLLLMGIDKA